jgi:hypothetical protein
MLGGVDRAPVFMASDDSSSLESSVGQINSVIDARTDEIDSDIGEKSNSAGDSSKSDVGWFSSIIPLDRDIDIIKIDKINDLIQPEFLFLKSSFLEPLGGKAYALLMAVALNCPISGYPFIRGW